MQNIGINCSLINRSNYFSTQKKEKRICWSGRYFCKSYECDLVYEAVIEKWPYFEDNLCCTLYWEGDCQHERVNLPQTQCRGKDRQQLSLEVMSKGTDTVFTENKLKDITKDDCNGLIRKRYIYF